MGRVHVAAVQADGQGQVRAGQVAPHRRAALDERRLLGAQLVVEAPAEGLGVAPSLRGVQGAAVR